MSDAQVLIRDAQDKAERLCAIAVEQTPAAYQSFITLIEQRRKVGGTRQAPIFATVRQPYLSVDGRVKWARDEHLRAGKRFDVQTAFVVEPTSGQLLACATVTSEIYGTAVAHARVFLGGDGVNESNPLETGETSALGRALGMWGFGCYGTGIASAEEVLRVAERPDGSAPGAGSSGGPGEGTNAAGDPAAPAGAAAPRETDRADELVRLGHALGLRPGEVALRRAQAGSDEEAVAALGTAVAELLQSDATTREALLTHAGRLGVEVAAYRAYLVVRYELTDPEAPESALDDEQLREERGRFMRRYQEPEAAAGFRAQCARVLRSRAA
jgi:hypothetical protein